MLRTLLLRVCTGQTRNHRHDSAGRGGRGREKDSPHCRRSPYTGFSVCDARRTVTRKTGILSRRGFAHCQTDNKWDTVSVCPNTRIHANNRDERTREPEKGLLCWSLGCALIEGDNQACLWRAASWLGEGRDQEERGLPARSRAAAAAAAAAAHSKNGCACSSSGSGVTALPHRMAWLGQSRCSS